MTTPTIEALIEAVLAKKQGDAAGAKEMAFYLLPGDAGHGNWWTVEIGNKDWPQAMSEGSRAEYAGEGPTLWAALTALLEQLP